MQSNVGKTLVMLTSVRGIKSGEIVKVSNYDRTLAMYYVVSKTGISAWIGTNEVI